MEQVNLADGVLSFTISRPLDILQLRDDKRIINFLVLGICGDLVRLLDTSFCNKPTWTFGRPLDSKIEDNDDEELGCHYTQKLVNSDEGVEHSNYMGPSTLHRLE